MNPLDVEVSYYPGHATDVISTATVNLFNYLTRPSPERIAKVQEVRDCMNPTEQDELKKAVGGITPSGIFAPNRADASLIKHSGIITLDVDADKNPGLDFAEFRSRVQSFEWVAACMYSVRGAGLAIYVPIEQPEKHREHFASLAAEFAEMGVKVDTSCVNLSRLRFNSFDPATYTNTSATRYNRLLTKPVPAPRRATYTATATPADIFSWAAKLVERNGVFFVDGYKHDFITRLSEILNRYGVPEADVWEHVSTTYIPRSEITSNCISGPYRQYANEHGTRTFKPAQRAARGKSNLHFPKRAVAPNPASIEATPSTEPEWQEVASFDWASSTTGQAVSDSTRLHEVEALTVLPVVPEWVEPELIAEPLAPSAKTQPTAAGQVELLPQANTEQPPTASRRKTLAALLSQDRKLFIETPPLNNTFTVYSSVEAYNSRSERPQFIAKEALSGQSLTVVLIDLEGLQIEGQHAPGQG